MESGYASQPTTDSIHPTASPSLRLWPAVATRCAALVADRVTVLLFVACVAAVVVPLLPTLLFDSVGAGQSDVPLHIRWLHGFQRDLSLGVWVPTWADEANAGFGSYPYHILGRGAYYAMAPLVPLAGGVWPAIKLGLLLFAGLGAFCSYRTGRLFFDQRLSLVVALFYVLGPYVCFENGNLGMMQCAALALAPWPIGRLVLLARTPNARNLSVFCMSYALLIFTHLIVAFVLGGTLVAMAGGYAVARRRIAPLVASVGGIGVALAMTSFYWIFIVAGIEGGQAVEFHEGVQSQWAHYMFTEGSWLIPDAAIPLCYMAVGGLALLVWGRPILRRQLSPPLAGVWGGLLVTLALGLLIQTSWSDWLWQRSSLLRRVDHPLRFDAALQFPVVLLLVGSVAAIRRYAGSRKHRSWLLGGWWATAAVNGGLGLFIPWYFYLSGQKTIADVPPHRPSDASMFYMKPSTARIDEVMERESSSTWRIRGASVVEAAVTHWTPHRRRIDLLSSGGPVQLRTFYYAGWELALDGQTVPIRAGEPYGQIEFDAPPGNHTAELRLVWPLRCRRAAVVSLASASLVGVLAVGPWPRRRHRSTDR